MDPILAPNLFTGTIRRVPFWALLACFFELAPWLACRAQKLPKKHKQVMYLLVCFSSAPLILSAGAVNLRGHVFSRNYAEALEE